MCNFYRPIEIQPARHSGKAMLLGRAIPQIGRINAEDRTVPTRRHSLHIRSCDLSSDCHFRFRNARDPVKTHASSIPAF